MISLKEQKGLTKDALRYIELLFNKDEEILKILMMTILSVLLFLA